MIRFANAQQFYLNGSGFKWKNCHMKNVSRYWIIFDWQLINMQIIFLFYYQQFTLILGKLNLNFKLTL